MPIYCINGSSSCSVIVVQGVLIWKLSSSISVILKFAKMHALELYVSNSASTQQLYSAEYSVIGSIGTIVEYVTLSTDCLAV